MDNKKGFTLAEVLITLGIIGVVAALTLPTLIQNHEEKATISKVKKFYSIVNQALLFAIKDNGTVDQWNISDETDPESGEFLYDNMVDYLIPYLKISKNCGHESGCIYEGYYKKLKGIEHPASYDSRPMYTKLILSDGSTLWLRGRDTHQNRCQIQDGDNENNICGLIWLDTNGKRPPNTLGKDLFVYFIKKDRIVPHSSKDCSLDSNGWGCAKYILQNDSMDYLRKK